MQIINWIVNYIVGRAYAFEPKDFSIIKDPDAPSNKKILEDITTSTGYANTLDRIIDYMLWAAGTLAFIALLVGAWQYLLAAGDQQKAATAKKTITYAIIGIVVIAMLFVILQFVASDLLKGILPKTP